MINKTLARKLKLRKLRSSEDGGILKIHVSETIKTKDKVG